MDFIKNLRLYPFIKNEIDVQREVLEASTLPRLMVTRYLELTLIRQNLDKLGLRERPPTYFQGVQQYSEYYGDYDPELDLYRADTLIARFDYTDLLLPRYWKLGIAAVGLNSVTLNKDRTDIIDVGDVHTFIDGTDGQTIKGQATVLSVVYALGVTTVVYVSITITLNVGDICYFPKGQRLAGIQTSASFYNSDGTIGLTKTERRPLSISEMADEEKLRRERSITHMIANAQNTDTQEEVSALFVHYSPYIADYERLGDWESWASAIDNETDATINSYLDISVPVRLANGTLLIKTVRQYLKDEMYKSYN